MSMIIEPMHQRKLRRFAYCRGCDAEMDVGTEVVAMRSLRSKHGQIIFCMHCAECIGSFAKAKRLEALQVVMDASVYKGIDNSIRS